MIRHWRQTIVYPTPVSLHEQLLAAAFPKLTLLRSAGLAMNETQTMAASWSWRVLNPDLDVLSLFEDDDKRFLSAP
jgi:hypothetical protein